jgi:large subunit ribosomal protein L22
MKVQAVSKNVKMSPRKVRLVADSVREQEINKAIAYLTVMSQRAAIPVRKTIESAVANAVNNFNVKKSDLFIAEINVGEGLAYKRYHYAARGRIRPYKRRTSHVTVVLDTKTTPAASVAAEAAVEEPKSEAKPQKKLLGRKKKEVSK